MSSAVVELQEDQVDEYSRYKALSSAAVATLVVGILSLLAFFNFWFAFVPVVGTLLGVMALKKIRANPEELTGTPIADVGLSVECAVRHRWPHLLALCLRDGSARMGRTNFVCRATTRQVRARGSFTTFGRGARWQESFHQRVYLSRPADRWDKAICTLPRSGRLLFWWQSENYRSNSSNACRAKHY